MSNVATSSSPVFAVARSPAFPRKHSLFPTPRWQDLWAAILFYLHLAFLLGFSLYLFQLGGWSLERFKLSLHVHGGVLAFLAAHFAGSVSLGLALAIISIGYMGSNPVQVIHTTYIANIALWFILAISMIFVNMWLSIPWFVIGAIGMIGYLWVRKRIPFSASILCMVVDCSHEYPSMYAVAGGSAAVFIGFSFLYSGLMAVLFSVAQKLNKGLIVFAFIYTIFSMFWTGQVIKNVTQTSIAGVFAVSYFTSGSGQRVSDAASQSLKRAVTYSFGSICLGSLTVAIIQSIRQFLRSIFRYHILIAAIADCILDVLDGLTRYFNYYAYMHIAIYGKSFTEAASDTWDLVKRRDVEVIVNDSLIGSCCFAISLSIALLAMCFSIGLSVFVYGLEWGPAIVIGVLFGFLAGQIAGTCLQVITAGSTATFVYFAEDPLALQRNNPTLFDDIVFKYGNTIA